MELSKSQKAVQIRKLQKFSKSRPKTVKRQALCEPLFNRNLRAKKAERSLERFRTGAQFGSFHTSEINKCQ